MFARKLLATEKLACHGELIQTEHQLQDQLANLEGDES